MELEPHSGREEMVDEEAVRFWGKLRERWHKLSPEQKVYYSGLGILAAGQAVDILTTGIGLNRNGISEQNPLGEYLYENGGVEALVLLKISALMIIVSVCEYARRSYKGNWNVEKIYGNTLRMANVFYAAVAVNNLLWLLDSFDHINL